MRSTIRKIVEFLSRIWQMIVRHDSRRGMDRPLHACPDAALRLEADREPDAAGEPAGCQPEERAASTVSATAASLPVTENHRVADSDEKDSGIEEGSVEDISVISPAESNRSSGEDEAIQVSQVAPPKNIEPTIILPPDYVQPENERGKPSEAIQQEETPTSGGIDPLDTPSHVDYPKGEKDLDQPPQEQVRHSHQKRRHIAPINRGGRPRDQHDTPVTRAVQRETKSRRPTVVKPELVCWKHGMSWVLGVEVPEELKDADVELRQDELLIGDSQRPLCYPLRDPLGRVQVSWENEDREQGQHIFPEEPYRIFKLTGDFRIGRRMNRVTRGRFLITVPDSWQRDVHLSGPEFLAPESVSGASLKAHHFEVDGESMKTAVFLKPEGGTESVPSQTKEFEFRGERVLDAEREAGYLFVGAPPNLVLLGAVDYATVVVGEEGSWQSGCHWRDVAARFDELRPSIRERGAGWYFVRLYDSSDQLIESLNFRYSKSLREIRMDAESPLPDTKGHCTASIFFRHTPSCSIQTVERNPQLKIECRDGETRVAVPPEAHLDKMRWTVLETGGRSIWTTILVERIWWTLTDEDHDVPEAAWTDKCCALVKEDFAPTSVRTLHIRLPIPGWATDVRIGFRQETAYRLETSPRQTTCALPLRNLGGQTALIEAQGQLTLRLWIWPRDFSSRVLEGIVASVQTPKETKVDSPKQLLLGNLCSPRLMSILSRLRHQLPGPARSIIGDLRKVYYHPARRGGTEEQFVFLRQGLCLLASLVELAESERCSSLKLGVPSHWICRARTARKQFPEDFVGWEVQLRRHLRASAPQPNQACRKGSQA